MAVVFGVGSVDEVGSTEGFAKGKRLVVVPFTKNTPCRLAQQSCWPMPQQYVPSVQCVTSASSAVLGMLCSSAHPASATRLYPIRKVRFKCCFD